MTEYLQQFSQRFSYRVYFTHGMFTPGNRVLTNAITHEHGANPVRIAVFIDEGLNTKTPALKNEIIKWFTMNRSSVDLVLEPLVFPGGEAVKNSWDHVHEVTRILAASGMDRHGFVMAIGGGAFLDMVGFATAIFHRGLKLIRIPTTTLAQNDAGIGVKNGINQFGQKNCIGTFAPPHAVINDFNFLSTLSFDHFIGGVAEAFKIAVIRDKAFFNFLEDNSHKLRSRDPEAIEHAIIRCADLHLNHIAGCGDPFETGSSRPLDYGHWSGHKIEILSGSAIPHGQAVSIGIALDSYYAWKKSLLTESEFNRLIQALLECGLPVWNPFLEKADSNGTLEIQKGLEEFRQHLGGPLTFTMPDGIGKACELHDMDFDIILQGIAYLRNEEKKYCLKSTPNPN